jgi:hypothetical protein
VSILDAFPRARALLGLSPEERDPRQIKKAYRRKVAEFPPDQAPEEFRSLRAAYELLVSPHTAMRQALEQRTPDLPLPPAPEVPPLPVGLTTRHLLASLTAQIDLSLPEDPPTS